MSEGISSDKGYKTRSALGDITNHTGKRGFSFVSSLDVKAKDGYSGHVDKKLEGAQFGKKVCGKLDNLMKEGMSCVSLHPCSEINSLKGNVMSVFSKIPSGIKDPDLADGVTQIAWVDVITNNIVNLGDVNNCDKNPLDVRGEIHEDKGLRSEVSDKNDPQDKAEANVCGNDENDLNSSRDDNVEFSRLPKSQESGISGLERCIGLKGDGCSNSSEGVDLIKACSCSICLKAAYIWFDLHYQDMKGRIAASKKSRNEASLLIQKSCRENEPEKRSQGNLNRFSRLESDLPGHWTSLFRQTEDILVREVSQLEASVSTLKGL